MALVNHAKREINAKIVYYGHEGAGKRVSLQYLYDRIKPSLRGALKTVPASGDSLIFFDFSPFEHPMFGGYRIRFHMYSLTGKVANPATWKMTLKGADGVVIVADASSDMVLATRESISRLRGFLAAYGVGLHDIPCVLQLNRVGKSGHSSEAAIALELEVPDMRTCLSEAGSGRGVLDALSLISRDIMARIGQDDALRLVERGMTVEEGIDSDERSSPPPTESEELVPGSESNHSGVEKTFSNAAKQEKNAEGYGCLQVGLSGEGASCSDGTVRIPLEIMVGGESRRLVVSVSIE
jgi:signal recognition particle receptor subunit beta